LAAGRSHASQRHPAVLETDEAASLDALADLHVEGTCALDWKVERVMTEMRKRGLLSGAA
jgi:hypothetical protein